MTPINRRTPVQTPNNQPSAPFCSAADRTETVLTESIQSIQLPELRDVIKSSPQDASRKASVLAPRPQASAGSSFLDDVNEFWSFSWWNEASTGGRALGLGVALIAAAPTVVVGAASLVAGAGCACPPEHFDASRDGRSDARTDARVDASRDATSDAPMDAGRLDAGRDASADVRGDAPRMDVRADTATDVRSDVRPGG